MRTHFNFVGDVMEPLAAQRPEAPALWWVNPASGQEKRSSFKEMVRLAHQAANFFHSCGLRRGKKVIVMLPRIPEWWISLLGLIRAGALPIPCTQLLTERDLSYRIKTAQADAVITDPEGAAKLSQFAGLRIGVEVEETGWLDLSHGILTSDPKFRGEPTRADDPGLLYFTSATTGSPKMVLHSQSSYGQAHESTGRYWLDLGPDDIIWNISDVGWGKAAWSSFFGPWHMGSCVFALHSRGRFDPVLTLQTLARYPITTWCAPPTALRLVLQEDFSRYHFPSLRHCVSAGEPLNPEIISRWQKSFGLTIYEAYGQTETVVLIGNFRSLGFPIRPGSMGKVAPGWDVALLDQSLQPVPDGQEGEIAIRVKPYRPAGLFMEYWQNSSQMAQHFQGDWYLTGDRALRDADGYFWFIGRTDDVIKSSGYRIGPFEVESVLMEHPAVQDTAVVGKPDPLRGQIVKAFVILKNGFPPGPEMARMLEEHCKRLAAPYKHPREIEFVQELPKTISGKTRRAELRQRS